MNNLVTITTRLAEFKAAFTQGIEGIVKAAEIYVAALDEDPRNADKFRDAFSDMLPPSAWGQLESVGRKVMHPRLLMGGVCDRKKSTFIKRLAYSMQERVFNRERFKLLTEDGQTLEVDLMEATPEQCEQLCDGSGIRNLSAQKAWMEARKVHASEPCEVLPYTISGDRVTFRRGCVLTRAEMKRLLTEM